MKHQIGKLVHLCLILFFLFDSTFEQQEERLALLKLRSSLGLRAKEWPLKGTPCSNWKGITCKNGKVTKINISSFKRTRHGNQNPQFLVNSLQNLTLLESFNASNFALPGSIPEWFGFKLSSLKVLDLRFCSLTGTIPLSLGRLSSLEVLDLSHNLLVGPIPASFGTLSQLKFFNLADNSLSSSIPAQLGDLENLVDLDLGLNNLVGVVPKELRGLRNLQRMVIKKNSLSGLLSGDVFVTLTELQFLAIDNNDLSGSLPSVLWSMPRLQFVGASANKFTGTLSNVGSNVNATSAVFNLSQNILYGNLPPLVSRFSFLDLSGNYFQGKVPQYGQSDVLLNGNCLQNLGSQRNTSECSSFYEDRGLVFNHFGVPNVTQPPAPKSDKKSRKNVVIFVAVLGGFGLAIVIIFVVLLLIICSYKMSTKNQKVVGMVPVSPSPGTSLSLSSVGDAFNYQQILQTGEFSDANLIKHGHSGDLFRGILEDGSHVVVKRIDLSTIRKERYLFELDFFSKVSHPRLVPLLGHCLENENEKFLVYKYMPNGDLSSSLFRKTDSDDDSSQSLDWITRLQIAIGAAEGLSYLHHECSPPLVHRDVQASSILLNDKFEVCLGSLNEVCAEGDTHQNRISRLLRLPRTSEQGVPDTTKATRAYDVYCFGKVLLELVTGKLGVSASSDASMKEWLDKTLRFISMHDKQYVTNILDPSLIINEDLLEEVWVMAIIAKCCLNSKPSSRLLMRQILKALKNPLKVSRGEHTSSTRLRATSSRGSWNATLFRSWRLSFSDVAPANEVEGANSFKQSATTGSQRSSQIEGGGRHSSTRRRSKEIFPEALDEQDVERIHDE